MSHNQSSYNWLTFTKPANIKRQRGSSLAIAVFVIIVMSLLTTAITNTISSSSDQVVQEVLGTRALLAAESANEITLTQVFPIDDDANSCADADVVVGRRYFNNITGLENCLAVTSCSDNTIDSETYYLVESTGVCKGALANDVTDETCNNTDEVCVSRSVEVEARTVL